MRRSFSGHRQNHPTAAAPELPASYQTRLHVRVGWGYPAHPRPPKSGVRGPFHTQTPGPARFLPRSSSCKSSPRPRSPRCSLESPLAGSWGSPGAPPASHDPPGMRRRTANPRRTRRRGGGTWRSVPWINSSPRWSFWGLKTEVWAGRRGCALHFDFVQNLGRREVQDLPL